jgi:hypothetical protein
MARKLLMVTVRGTQHTWAFPFYGDPADMPDWAADGLDVVEVVNVIPDWVPPGMTRLWCALQDVFNFKNPFAR